MKHLLAACLLPVLTGPLAWSQNIGALLPKQLRGVGIEQHLNAQMPLDAEFTDEAGRHVRLRDYTGSRPVILALVYYQCTMLCNQTLNGIATGLRPLSLRPGKDFAVLAISINPRETPTLAYAKKLRYGHSSFNAAESSGWHFLTGTEPNIHAVAETAGFRYRYDPKTDTFLHGSGILILTPEGKVARYLFGVDFKPKDLKLGLLEASRGRIGSAADQVLVFCYRYDPTTGTYSVAVLNLLRLSAAATILIAAVTLGIFWREDIRTGPKVTGKVR